MVFDSYIRFSLRNNGRKFQYIHRYLLEKNYIITYLYAYANKIEKVLVRWFFNFLLYIYVMYICI